MHKLFDSSLEPASQGQPGKDPVRTVSVAVNANLWRNFDYLWPDSLGQPQQGQRVRVPFGKSNRKTLAFVVDVAPAPDEPGRQLKAVAEVLDEQSQFDPVLWKLAAWMSQYYLTPLGMTLAAMIPSSVGKHASRSETVVWLASERADWPRRLGGRQKRLLDELFEARLQGIEPLTAEQLQHHSGGSSQTLASLLAKGLIRTESRPVRLPELAEPAQVNDIQLNDEQTAAVDAIGRKIEQGGFTAILLQGVTGSGKTAVYIRAIQQVISRGQQAILLAPEIALATQTLGRLIKRLPRVAVLHSGLTSAQRSFYYEQIRDGHASVVIGPRSALFAPTRKLGLVIVDEEHESSYKQDVAPRYHGRDAAVMRASLAGVPVILGSATPSLESTHNVRAGRYELIRLTKRVRGLPMPRLQIVNFRQDLAAGKVELLGQTLTRKMAATLDRGEQIILLMNRRGYASYVFCPHTGKCGWLATCDHCSRALVFHQATQMMLCHYCQHASQLPEKCPACDGKLLLFGYGIQRIENELARKFPQARSARMDSDTMTSPAQFQKIFDQLSAGEIDILLGTQMVAKGLDFPKVTLVGVASADTSLVISDFRAAERTFQLIVQVAGRAGRGDSSGEVIVQTLHQDEPAIIAAVSHDYDSFAQRELDLRQQTSLPPISRLVRFIVRHEDSLKAQAAADELARRLVKLLPTGVARMTGPKPAAVGRIRNQYRFEVLVTPSRAGQVQAILGPRMEQLLSGLSAEVLADADPIALM